MSTEDLEEVQRQRAAWRDHAQEELSEGRSRDEVVASLVALGQPEEEARRLVSALVPRSIWIARIPPDAEPSELAAAPVMGSRREVAAHIHAAIPGMRFDQSGRGVIPEVLRYSWFSSDGKFSEVRTGDARPWTKWQADESYQPPPESKVLSLWLVLQDGRNGTDKAYYEFDYTD